MSTTTQIAESTVASEPVDGRREVMELDVSGMTCGSCAARVQRTLGRQSGVVEAEVNYATGRATVYHQPGVGADALMAAIRKAGYDAAPVVADPAGQRSPFEA